MTAYFLDSSAGAKLYVAERGSAWISGLINPGLSHEFFALRLMAVEVAAAMFRRVRAGHLLRDDAITATTALRSDFEHFFHVVELSPAIVDLSFEVAERHGLRGYDCVHLAGILAIHRSRLAVGLDRLQVISADLELNAAVATEGLAVLDPNNYQ